MTVRQARILLGNKHKDLSDEKVRIKINSLGKFADELINTVLQKIDTININGKSNNSS